MRRDPILDLLHLHMKDIRKHREFCEKALQKVKAE